MEAAWWSARNTEDRKITFIWSQIRWWWFRQWMLTQKWMRWFCFILPILPRNCHTTAHNYTLAPQEGLFKKRLLLFLLGCHLSEVYVRYLQMFSVFQGTEATHLQSRDWARRAALLMLPLAVAGVKSFSPKHGLPLWVLFKMLNVWFKNDMHRDVVLPSIAILEAFAHLFHFRVMCGHPLK